MSRIVNNHNIQKIKLHTFLIFISVIVLSCNAQKTEKADENVQVFNQDEMEAPKFSLEGEWKLDSVVFTDNNIRGRQQIPISTTIWSFSRKNNYVVKILKNQIELNIQNNGQQQVERVKADVPLQEMKGRYRIKENELITNILGGEIKYQIIGHSDTSLHLKSQRIQVPPISEEDKGKLAEHYLSK